MMYGVAVFLLILVIAWVLSPDLRRHRNDDSDFDDDST